VQNKLGNETGFSFQFFTSIQACKNEWLLATNPDNLFLQNDYLTLLEQHPPAETNFVYTLISCKNSTIGVAYFQYKDFKPGESLNYEKKGFNPFSNFKIFVAKQLNFSTLVSGNLLLTGEHGFYVKPEFQSNLGTIYAQVLDETIAFLKTKKVNISLFFVKDFHDKQDDFSKKSNSFSFNFQPNMIMELRPEWKSMDDYLAAMLNKYRTRAKRAFKKGDSMARVELDIEQLELHKVRLYELYKSVANNAGFNLFHLNKNYIPNLKKYLGDDFTLLGYFIDNQLVGFCTTIKNYSELEAHCIGFDSAYNPTHQIYLNMLYDMIQIGILSKSEKIVFARTAMEIKSTVGAVGHNMFCYIRHSNRVLNYFLPKIIGFLDTNEQWEQRHPFGKD
jgi:hypothetical protein